MVLHAFIFGFVGLGLEVFFTAATSLRSPATARRRFLMGYSSLWYLPLYGMAPVVLGHLQGWLFAQPWPVRGLVYMSVSWVAEYLSMGALRLLLGESPSEESYRRARWSVHGLTRLDHGPAYAAAGFVFEWIFRSLHRVA